MTEKNGEETMHLVGSILESAGDLKGAGLSVLSLLKLIKENLRH